MKSLSDEPFKAGKGSENIQAERDCSQHGFFASSSPRASLRAKERYEVTRLKGEDLLCFLSYGSVSGCSSSSSEPVYTYILFHQDG